MSDAYGNILIKTKTWEIFYLKLLFLIVLDDSLFIFSGVSAFDVLFSRLLDHACTPGVKWVNIEMSCYIERVWESLYSKVSLERRPQTHTHTQTHRVLSHGSEIGNQNYFGCLIFQGSPQYTQITTTF